MYTKIGTHMKSLISISSKITQNSRFDKQVMFVAYSNACVYNVQSFNFLKIYKIKWKTVHWIKQN